MCFYFNQLCSVELNRAVAPVVQWFNSPAYKAEVFGLNSGGSKVFTTYISIKLKDLIINTEDVQNMVNSL